MNTELIEALNILEREKEVSKEVMFETIENALVTAYRNNFAKSENVKAEVDRETGEFKIYIEKTVVDEVDDPVNEISLEEAKKINRNYKVGSIAGIRVKSEEFSRVAAQTGKSIILQKIREEERRVVFDKFSGKANDVITGVVQKIENGRIKINLGKADAFLSEKDMIPGEVLKPNDRVKLYVADVKNDGKSQSPRIAVTRTHPDLVRRLFEAEVAEMQNGIVEIINVAREPGSRSKICVRSKNKKVDPVGACVGINGTRVGAVVSELNGEKIDIINWDENPAIFIQNALSPSKVVSVEADDEVKTAKVIVPDSQLSLAIGKEGQNARLAAKLTGFRIDIKSESQAAQMSEMSEIPEDMADYAGEMPEDFAELSDETENGD